MRQNSTRRCGYLAAVLGVAGLVGAPGAWAAASISLTSDLPGGLAVGRKGLAGSIAVTNTSTSPQSDSDEALVLASLSFVPACGQAALAADCPPGFREPGVISLGASASGVAGTACAGISFAVSTVDPAQGKLQLVPSAPVVLAIGRPGQSPTCRIGFTFDVLRMPTFDADPMTAGVQTARIAVAAANHTDGVSNASAIAPQLSTAIAPAPVTVRGSADGGLLNTPTTDTAVLTATTGAPGPTGTLTFSLYGPDDPTCAHAPLFTMARPVTGDGTYASDPAETSVLGLHHWVASYGGDANSAAAGTACGDPAQTVDVRSANVVTGPANKVGRLSATLTGSVSTAGPSSDTTYVFEYGPTASYGSQTAAKPLGPGVSGVPAAAILTKLRAGTSYHYRLVATNAGGSVAGTDRAFTTRPKEKADRLTLSTTPRRDRRAPYRFVFRGKLVLPAAIAPAQGCSGSLAIHITRGKRTLITKHTTLSKRCNYARRLTIGRAARGTGRLKATVTFFGNSVVRRISTGTAIRAG